MNGPGGFLDTSFQPRNLALVELWGSGNETGVWGDGFDTLVAESLDAGFELDHCVTFGEGPEGWEARCSCPWRAVGDDEFRVLELADQHGWVCDSAGRWLDNDGRWQT